MTSQSEPTTLTLLERAAEGDAEAVDVLFRRYSRPLRRWASGRLPTWARDMTDTDDLVQDAMLQTFRRLNHFEYRGQGALLGYLREAVLNGIRQELRRRGRRPEAESVDEEIEATGASPLELAVGNETLASYERALAALSSGCPRAAPPVSTRCFPCAPE